MADKFFVKDEGADIICECGETITGATGTVIKYQKPDGTEGEWVAEIYDDPESELTDSTLKYTVKAGDWDLAGNWYVNPYLVLSGWKGHGETDAFTLHEVFTP